MIRHASARSYDALPRSFTSSSSKRLAGSVRIMGRICGPTETPQKSEDPRWVARGSSGVGGGTDKTANLLERQPYRKTNETNRSNVQGPYAACKRK